MHRDYRPAIHRGAGQADFVPRLGSFQGVLEQVGEHPLQQHRVAGDQQPGRQVQLQAQGPGFGDPPERGAQAGHQFGQVQQLGFQVQAAPLGVPEHPLGSDFFGQLVRRSLGQLQVLVGGAAAGFDQMDQGRKGRRGVHDVVQKNPFQRVPPGFGGNIHDGAEDVGGTVDGEGLGPDHEVQLFALRLCRTPQQALLGVQRPVERAGDAAGGAAKAAESAGAAAAGAVVGVDAAEGFARPQPVGVADFRRDQGAGLIVEEHDLPAMVEHHDRHRKFVKKMQALLGAYLPSLDFDQLRRVPVHFKIRFGCSGKTCQHHDPLFAQARRSSAALSLLRNSFSAMFSRR